LPISGSGDNHLSVLDPTTGKAFGVWRAVHGWEDEFTRANNTVLGSAWTNYSGGVQFGITSNAAVAKAANTLVSSLYNTPAQTTDHKIRVIVGTVTASDTIIYLDVRSDAGTASVQAVCGTGATWTIKTMPAGTTRATSGTLSFVAGDILEFGCLGNVYTLSKNKVSVLTWTDSGNAFTYTSANVYALIGTYTWAAANRGIASFAFTDINDGVWSGEWGGIADLGGDGIDSAGGSTAGHLARHTAVLQADEMTAAAAANTGLNHALFFSTNILAPTVYQYPAMATDGANPSGVPTPIPIGSRVQLDPSISDATIDATSGITAGEKVIAKTLKTHGAYVGDSGGSRMGFLAERVRDATAWDTAPGTAWVALGFEWDYWDMTHIPWSSLRVLKNWDGSA
jgi:hypothetical protein